MPGPLLIAGISAGLGIINSLSGASRAKKAARKARRDQARIEAEIRNYKRQELVNPYEGLTNQRANITNPFAGQQVGLRGAEFATEQQDQNLANILDQQLQAGGQSAANATALARQSGQFAQQQGANIQQQELANQQRFNTAEFQRQQYIAEGAERVQQLKAQGEQYLLGIRENRDIANLQGLGQRLSNAQYAETSAQQARAAQNAAVTQGLFNFAGSAVSAGLGGGGNAPAGTGIDNTPLFGDNGQFLQPGTVGFKPGQFNLLQGF